MNLLYTPLIVLSALFSVGSLSAADFYVGTYTEEDAVPEWEAGRGIYHYQFDSQTGAISGGELAVAAVNPSFLAIPRNGKFLYAVSEVDSFAGQNSGALSAYAIEADGRLRLLNQQTSGGEGPCHVSIGRAGRYAFVANYGGGSVEALPIEANGRLSKPSALVQFSGSGPNPERQESSHAHCVSLVGEFVYVCDLGTDHLEVFRFDSSTGQLTAHEPPFVGVAAGSGPRHLVFHGGYAYVINELLGSIGVFAHDAKNGALAPIQTISTLPADFHGENTTAEILVHSNGKFLYASNRGHNSLASYSIGADGKLTALEWTPSGGTDPRFFTIDPTGHWLLAANQASNNLVVFKLDPATGKLESTGQSLKVGAPVAIAFAP